jgi:predicted amidohydrolase YtcJ
MTVVPGFIDCHNHAGGETLLYDVLVGNPFEVEFVSILSIVGKLKAKSQNLPPGTWVEGYFFDDTKVKDTRGLHRKDLDEVSKDHPVVVRHRGGHTSFYNTKAFEMAGITKDTPNPPGGTYDKDPDGQLNGRVTDRAMDHLHAGRGREARPRRHRPYLEDVHEVRPDQRAPRGRQPGRHPGRARPRRAAAPGQLRGTGPGAREHDQRRHQDRLRG